MTQLTEVNTAVLDAMVNHGFSPKELSDIMCFVLFNTVTDFRNKYDIKSELDSLTSRKGNNDEKNYIVYINGIHNYCFM